MSTETEDQPICHCDLCRPSMVDRGLKDAWMDLLDGERGWPVVRKSYRPTSRLSEPETGHDPKPS